MKLKVIKPKVALAIHHKVQKCLRFCRNYWLFSLWESAGPKLSYNTEVKACCLGVCTLNFASLHGWMLHRNAATLGAFSIPSAGPDCSWSYFYPAVRFSICFWDFTRPPSGFLTEMWIEMLLRCYFNALYFKNSNCKIPCDDGKAHKYKQTSS